MVDIRKASISFIVLLFCSYFLYHPVNADVPLPFRPYQPEILYLVRHNYLEDLGFPSKPEDKPSQYVYAIVRDIYGKTLHGSLTYTIDNEKPQTIPMTLVMGIPVNGTWQCEIPIPETETNSTVRPAIL